MERPTTSADGPAGWMLSFGAWLLGATLLLTWQGWLTLQLFGDDPIEQILNDQPIVAGAHPQNLYLGSLGAWAIANQGRTSVYDVAFQAGYPKTPIFDGSRLAELYLLLGGGTYQPAAYKLGTVGLCLMVPIFLLLSCRALDLQPATALLATFLGQLVWWGPHGQNALQTGHCELYLASLAGLAHIGFLISFHRTTSVRAWFGLWLTGCLSWFLQPLLFPIALPVILVFYLSVGVKHDFLTWHIAFATAEAFAFLVNLPWLTDWLDSWWLRASLPTNVGLLEHRTFETIWFAPLWAGSTERMLLLFLMGSASVGVTVLNQTHQRPTARLLGMSSTGALVLALLGISWEPLGAVGTAALLAPALWFACIPAAHAWVCATLWLWRLGPAVRFAPPVLLGASAACFVLFTDTPEDLIHRCVRVDRLPVGLGSDRQQIVNTLLQYTTPDARILWEDRARPPQASRWSALLPLLTERAYIGGLDPDGFIEHSSISLMNQLLDGRPIATWSDEELQEYCRRYNVRWIVAWTPTAIHRFEEWKMAKKVAPVTDEQAGWLYEVDRKPDFALKGHADFLHADGHDITLGNVVPRNGEVIVSLHYQTGMRASPGRVQIERADSGVDRIGFVRLRLAVPAARVTLAWER